MSFPSQNLASGNKAHGSNEEAREYQRACSKHHTPNGLPSLSRLVGLHERTELNDELRKIKPPLKPSLSGTAQRCTPLFLEPNHKIRTSTLVTIVVFTKERRLHLSVELFVFQPPVWFGLQENIFCPSPNNVPIEKSQACRFSDGCGLPTGSP